MLVVALGVLAVRGLKRAGAWARPRRSRSRSASRIATYTLLDKEGLEHAAAIPYLGVEVGVARRCSTRCGSGRDAAARRARRGARVLVGAGAFASYGLVLAALELAPAAAVAAVRETSVVFAVALAALFLGERVTAARAAGAVLVAAGVALVAPLGLALGCGRCGRRRRAASRGRRGWRSRSRGPPPGALTTVRTRPYSPP